MERPHLGRLNLGLCHTRHLLGPFTGIASRATRVSCRHGAVRIGARVRIRVGVRVRVRVRVRVSG